jgi:hypothetical protein
MVTLAGARPGDVASTVMFPAFLEDCTRAMQNPENAFRDLPLSVLALLLQVSRLENELSDAEAFC